MMGTTSPTIRTEIIDGDVYWTARTADGERIGSYLTHSHAESAVGVHEVISMHTANSFGKTLGDRRRARGYSLRKFAELVGVSPTYLSRVECGNADPPTAVRVQRMAELLDENPDVWIAMAGRVPEELLEIVREHPDVPALLRAVKGLAPDQIRRLRETAQQMKKEGTEGATS